MTRFYYSFGQQYNLRINQSIFRNLLRCYVRVRGRRVLLLVVVLGLRLVAVVLLIGRSALFD